jgi:hypothetical protein
MRTGFASTDYRRATQCPHRRVPPRLALAFPLGVHPAVERDASGYLDGPRADQAPAGTIGKCGWGVNLPGVVKSC